MRADLNHPMVTLLIAQYLQFRHMTRRATGFMQSPIINFASVPRLLLFKRDKKTLSHQ